MSDSVRYLKDYQAITPSDTDDLPFECLAFHLGTSGAVVVTDTYGRKQTLPALVAGWHWLRVRRIWSTGTVASANITIAR